MNIETLVSYIVDDASNRDWQRASERANLVNAGIAKLRERIEELGGYHDDI